MQESEKTRRKTISVLLLLCALVALGIAATASRGFILGRIYGPANALLLEVPLAMNGGRLEGSLAYELPKGVYSVSVLAARGAGAAATPAIPGASIDYMRTDTASAGGARETVAAPLENGLRDVSAYASSSESKKHLMPWPWTHLNRFQGKKVFIRELERVQVERLRQSGEVKVSIKMSAPGTVPPDTWRWYVRIERFIDAV